MMTADGFCSSLFIWYKRDRVQPRKMPEFAELQALAHLLETKWLCNGQNNNSEPLEMFAYQLPGTTTDTTVSDDSSRSKSSSSGSCPCLPLTLRHVGTRGKLLWIQLEDHQQRTTTTTTNHHNHHNQEEQSWFLLIHLMLAGELHCGQQDAESQLSPDMEQDPATTLIFSSQWRSRKSIPCDASIQYEPLYYYLNVKDSLRFASVQLVNAETGLGMLNDIAPMLWQFKQLQRLPQHHQQQQQPNTASHVSSAKRPRFIQTSLFASVDNNKRAKTLSNNNDNNDNKSQTTTTENKDNSNNTTDVMSKEQFRALLTTPKSDVANKSISSVLSLQNRLKSAIVSGLGSWFIAQMLHSANIPPHTKCSLLTGQQCDAMYDCVQRIASQIFDQLQQHFNNNSTLASSSSSSFYTVVKSLRHQHNQLQNQQSLSPSLQSPQKSRLEWLWVNVNDAWLPPVRPAYHTWISLILSQEIPFAQSQHIRSRMYTLWGEALITPERIEALTDYQWLTCIQVPPNKVELIRAFNHWCRSLDGSSSSISSTKEEDPQASHLHLYNVDAVAANVKGIGVWSTKSFLVDTLSKSDVILSEDYYLRKNLQLILQLPNVPSPKEAHRLVENSSVPTQFTRCSRILRRLKKTSTGKIANQTPLQQSDFW